MADPRTPWQNLALFADGQPLLPFPLPPAPAPQQQGPNWQDLAAWAPPPQQPRAPLQSVWDLTPQPLSPGAMPTAAESADLARQGQELASVASNVAPLAVAGPMGMAGRGVAALATRFPRAATAAAGAAGLTAAPGQANEPTPLDTARDTIARLRRSQTDLEAEEKQLKGEQQRFGKLNRNDPAAIRQAQETLQSQGLYLRNSRGQPVKPDGIWGDGMALAIEAYQDRVTKALATNERSRASTGKDLETQQTRLTGLEGGERLRQSEADVGPFRRAFRDWGPMAGLVLGGTLGHWTRARAVGRVADESAERAGLADAMMAGKGGAAQARAARVNDFWRQGGAGEEVPFRTVQTARGFSRRPGAAEPSDLYRPGPTRYRGSDIGVAAGGLGEAGVSGGLWYLAHNELEAAQAAAQADPSTINIDRLQKARDMVAAAETLARAGIGTTAGRLGGAWSHPYREARPNVAAGEREQMLLNRLLAQDAAKKAKGRRK